MRGRINESIYSRSRGFSAQTPLHSVPCTVRTIILQSDWPPTPTTRSIASLRNQAIYTYTGYFWILVDFHFYITLPPLPQPLNCHARSSLDIGYWIRIKNFFSDAIVYATTIFHSAFFKLYIIKKKKKKIIVCNWSFIQFYYIRFVSFFFFHIWFYYINCDRIYLKSSVVLSIEFLVQFL